MKVRRWAVLVVLVAAVAASTSVVADPAGAVPRPGSRLVLGTPPLAQYTDRLDHDPAGPSLGDLVTFRAPVTKAGSSAVVGYMTGSLRNVAVDFPRAGVVVREVNLVFVLRGGKDQLVVGGVAEYPKDGPTLPNGSETDRPLVGGLGRYAGARGWVTTVHDTDDTWTHTFHFTN